MSKTIFRVDGPFGGSFRVVDNSGVVEVKGGTGTTPIGTSSPVEVITGAQTLTAADAGKTFLLDAAGGATVTLPALTAGFTCKFVVSSAFASTNWVIDSAEGDNINGFITVDDAAILAAAEDQINLVATAETIGDHLNFICDSTNSQWIVTGHGEATGAMTATDP